jgi:ribosomal protein S18 acetylase RimI-like enzyme
LGQQAPHARRLALAAVGERLSGLGVSLCDAGARDLHISNVVTGAASYKAAVAGQEAAPDLAFERIRLGDMPEVIALAHANVDPRIASYAVEPLAGARRARLRALVSALPGAAALRLCSPEPERAFWITSNAEGGRRRAGFVLLYRRVDALHLDFVVLDRELRGTGAADVVMRFVEDQARDAGCRRIDLYVDRRNHRAYHLYRRHGFALAPERRFVFEVPRTRAPSPRALAAAPWHVLAEVLGGIGARGLGAPTGLQKGLLAVISVDPSGGDAAVAAAVDLALRNTLARAVRVTLPFSAHVPHGHLVAILHRMERGLS